MTKVWSWRQAIQKSKLAPTTRLVLFNLANYMDSVGGGCFPSTIRQSEDTGLSERAICTHLKKAVDAGYLDRRLHGCKGQKWARYNYSACFPNDMELCRKGTELHDIGEGEGTEPNDINSYKGTEPNDIKALNEGQSNYPYNYPIDINKKNTKKGNVCDGRFDEFWEQYGKIGNKQQAIKSYNKSIKGGTLHETIIGGVEKYQAYARANNTERKYIKHASTWLNNRGWEDDYPITSTGYSNKPTSRDYEEAAIRGMLRAENPDF